MRRLIPVLAAATLGALLAFSPPPAFAKTAKECRADYAANKDALKAAGQTRKAYVAACKTAPDAAPAASAGAAPVLTKTKAQCAAEYAANIKAIKASGQTRAAFDADCRAGTEKIGPAPAAAASAPAEPPPPADPMAPKPLMSPTAGLPAPAAAEPAKPEAALSPAQTQLKAKCPSDRIVWVNAKAGVYDLPGARGYGKTKPGAFMCEMDAKAAGDRRAGAEKDQ